MVIQRGKQRLFENFIDAKLLPGSQEFVSSQTQQAWTRFVLGIIFTAYIAFHGPYFDRILGILSISIPVYLCINLYSIYWIRKQPYSAFRLLLIPVIDCYLITLAMWADGGHMSVAFFLLMSPIIGNGFRFGSKMLRYCQLLGFISMVAISLITVFHLHLTMDWLGLVAELFGIFYISSYAYTIIKKTEAVLQGKLAAEASASRLIAENPHPAFTFDPDVPDIPILYANPAMSTLISGRPELLSGKAIDSIVISKDKDTCLSAVRPFDSTRTRHCYVRLPGVLDHPIQVKCEISSIQQEGRHIGLCYLTDISESERLQFELAEAQKLAYAAALAAGIAHDFRNVLAGIIGQSELIQLEHNDPKIKADAQRIISAGERGSKMIDQLLELGSSNGSDYQVMNISDSISNMLQIARVQLPPDITLNVKVQPDLPLVRANIAQLEQVLLNLIGNSAKSMPDNKGGIEISLSSCDRGPNKKALRLTVRDNGCGIEPENLQHIFKPFWSTRKQSGGSGLGMAMVQRIVRWHEGEIDVDSTPGKGTSISICLPKAGGKDAGPAPLMEYEDNSSVPIPNPDILPWKILLVEDQAEVLRIHKAFLTSMGLRVIVAGDGKEAFELYRNRTSKGTDMIITDYMMPKMDGMQLAKKIRQVDQNIPITMITAFGEDQALASLTMVNIQMLKKPLSYHTLVKHILQVQKQGNHTHPEK